MQNTGSATRWGRSIVAAGTNHTIGIASNGTTLPPEQTSMESAMSPNGMACIRSVHLRSTWPVILGSPTPLACKRTERFKRSVGTTPDNAMSMNG